MVGYPQRWIFAAKKLGVILLLWLLDSRLIQRVPSILDTGLHDFEPKHQQFAPWPLTPGPALMRAIIAFHWIWASFRLLVSAHAAMAVVFVAMLHLDEPQEWPPLFGDPRQAYSLRRFWARFWHGILRAPHASCGEVLNRRVLRLRPGSRAEKAMLAFWAFAGSAVTHTLVNWQTSAPGPLFGDAQFMMANFLACAIETMFCNSSAVRHLRIPGRIKKGLGFVWVAGFFYCVAAPWQYAKLYNTIYI